MAEHGEVHAHVPMSDALGDYLNTISRVPLLTNAEELHLGRLVRRWQDDPSASPLVVRRGKRALDRIVSANLRLVVSVVKRYRRRIVHLAIEPIDLIQAGNIGLIRAVEKFDPGRGYRFSTYAYWWIRQSVSRHVQEAHAPLRIPAALASLIGKIETILDRTGRLPSTQELSDKLGESPKRIEAALALRHLVGVISLDQPLAGGDASDLTLLDGVTDGTVPEPVDDYLWLHGQLHQLSGLELDVLHFRYTADERCSLKQVAEQLGRSKFQIQAIERRALMKLRAALGPVLEPVSRCS